MTSEVFLVFLLISRKEMQVKLIMLLFILKNYLDILSSLIQADMISMGK